MNILYQVTNFKKTLLGSENMLDKYMKAFGPLLCNASVTNLFASL